MKDPMPFRSIDDPASLQRLLEAVALINRDLSLPSILRHSLGEARTMTCARHGAIGILDHEGTAFKEFVTTPEEHERIDSPPANQGVLGQLIADPRPLRINNLGLDLHTSIPLSGHTPVTSFLGVPIKVREEVYGCFYMTEKVGSPNFTSNDEALIEAFAFAVGIAVEHSRLRAVAVTASLSNEREQLARDLHDTTIQHLFALGLKLQSIRDTSIPSEVSEDLTSAVVHIDELIERVRTTIFEEGYSHM